MHKLSIVIPIYNEEGYILKTVKAVVESSTNGLHKEIILIDDGSKDKSSGEIIQAQKNFKKKLGIFFKVISKKNNEGKGAALKDGFLATTGDIVLVQDADLEYNPEDYPLLLEPFLKHNADVVYGSRFISNRPHRVLYFWHSKMNIFLTSFSNMLTNLNFTDMETGYKVFNGELIRKIAKNLESKRFGFEPEITAKISKVRGIKIYEVGISYAGRTYAEGKKIGWKDGVKAIWEIVRFNLFTN